MEIQVSNLLWRVFRGRCLGTANQQVAVTHLILPHLDVRLLGRREIALIGMDLGPVLHLSKTEENPKIEDFV